MAILDIMKTHLEAEISRLNTSLTQNQGMLDQVNDAIASAPTDMEVRIQSILDKADTTLSDLSDFLKSKP